MELNRALADGAPTIANAYKQQNNNVINYLKAINATRSKCW